MALFSVFNRRVSKQPAEFPEIVNLLNDLAPDAFKWTREWLRLYAERDKLPTITDGKTGELIKGRGVVLRQILANRDLPDDHLLVLYLVCRDDADAATVLLTKMEKRSFTAQDMIRVVHSDLGYALMAEYTQKIRNLARK